MKRTALTLIGSALLGACSTNPNAEPSFATASLAANALTAAPSEPTAEQLTRAPDLVVDLTEPRVDDTPICETKRRAGSRIPTTVCYTAAQRAALEQQQAEAARQYARDLDRERMLKDQQPRPIEQQSPAIIVFQ
jgi:hypothetical protein